MTQEKYKQRFRIIPVIDILNSGAVHAVKGLREHYKPLRTTLFNTTNPYKIIKNLKFRYGINEIYIADLDSIINKKPNFKLFQKISKISDLKIMIDPGITSMEDVRIFSGFEFNKLIFGLETLSNLGVISKSIKEIGSNKIAISIDMYNGKIVTNITELNNLTITEIVKKIEHLGVIEIILLDLYRVGQKIGDIPPLYLEIRKIFNHNLLIGGGIKDFNDIVKCAQSYFSGVLLGTALYDGTIKIENLKQFLANQ